MAIIPDHDISRPLPADGLSRARPSDAGVDAAAIRAFVEDATAAGLELHTLMLHHRGRLVVDASWWPYRSDRPRVMHSVAKSVTACAIGLAIAEGRFGLRDRVVDFFPDEAPNPPDAKLAALTVDHLLTMRTGHAQETSGALWRNIPGSWVTEFFKIPIVHDPGTVHVYTSAASYMLAAILARTTGQTLHDYLKPRLFQPLGIEGEVWDIGPDGINPGGNGLTCKPVDILKLGILHAQDGVWNGRRILPQGWVAEATRSHGDGYGYHWVTRPDGSYAALGVFVQMALVFPEQGSTLVVTGAIDGSDKLLPHIDRHLPCALAGGGSPAADQSLADRLSHLCAPRALVSVPSDLPAALNGTVFVLEPNDKGVAELRFVFADGQCRFSLTDGEGTHHLVAGLDHWEEGVTGMPGQELHHGYRLGDAAVIAGARWVAANTLELEWIFRDTAFRDTVTCQFGDATITMDRRVNINSGPLSWPQLRGRAR